MITLTSWHYQAPVWSGTSMDGIESVEALYEIGTQGTDCAGREDGLDGNDCLWIWVSLTLH
jgi:hypothetical protein